jgi:DNA (cytosine-5)-methyltransferase 1
MAHAEDERATMYQYYLEYVHRLKPVAFVMENVREIGKYCNRNIAEEIATYAEKLGYNVRYSLLNAVWYGVPQLRERAFIIGVHKSIGTIPNFPAITHDHIIPTGYSTSREVE